MLLEVYFNFNPVNFFIISGILQNFILAAILLFRPSDRRLPNRLLSLIIMIINLHIMSLMILDTNLDKLHPWLLWIPYSFLSAIGPLFFFILNPFRTSTLHLQQACRSIFFPLLSKCCFSLSRFFTAFTWMEFITIHRCISGSHP